MGKIKEAIKQIWNRDNSRIEKQVWWLLGYSDGECPLMRSLRNFEQSYPHREENTNNSSSSNSSKTTKTTKTPKAGKRRVMVDKIRWFKNVLRVKRRIDKTLWWGDHDGACPVSQSLRAIDLHLSSLDICMAEAITRAEGIKRRQEEKQARFMAYIRAMKKNDKI